ncbi:extracellular solute-binding protein [Thalassobacillus pellis]|uniref:extracellular solute-binding protein n=1 Tax=Thalassobacillus pellis TaxID=748008 RepID=UPI001EF782B5|nr:extracellular solute-binding protein [Thalassobacillus pellis]MBM7553188.1 ABC-type glycerol-3-phosphate transport system substrate-binding protein [Thalassobacillus pellis]
MKSKVLFWSLLVLYLIPLTFVQAEGEQGDKDAADSADQIREQSYHLLLNEWKKKGLDSTASLERAIPPSSFSNMEDDALLPASESQGYGDRVFYWRNQNSLTVEVEVEREGLYEIGFDYFPKGNLIMPIEGAIQVNGEYPFSESRQINFPAKWKNASEDFQKDSSGNEIIPDQQPVRRWLHVKAEDSTYMYKRPLKFHLKKGKNTITLINLRGEMLVGEVYVTSPDPVPAYDDYIDSYPDAEKRKGLKVYEAEHPSEKNSSYIRPVAKENPSVSPYDENNLLLNTIGGDSWSKPGQKVSWKVDIDKAGFYKLTFKANQNKESRSPVYRTVLINDRVPFKDMEQYQFKYSENWYNETLSKEDGKPYYFYFHEGINKISLKADPSIHARVLFEIDEVMQGIDELSLSIRKLVGNQQGSRDWNIEEYIPGIEKKLLDWADRLKEEVDYLLSLSNGQESTEIASLQIAIDRLEALAEQPDEIPNSLTQLSTGSNSAAQLLGKVATDLTAQPLLLDRIYLHGDTSIPDAEAGFFTKAKDSVVNFFQSFSEDNLATAEVSEDTLEVWVNRPRQYVELLQNMTDQNFTQETGIKVKYSLMPDEQKLVLASAADTQPDVALGISNWVPYELAIRGAAVDLRQFEDFEKVGRQFSPGAFLPLVVEDGIYALPETQDFFVQFYRKDIMQKLDIPIPGTWEEVIEILPELQRYGMNYYIPLAGESAFKAFQTTAPFIYQFGGKLYEEDGIGTAIDEENALRGIQFMADLSTIYSMPLQVPRFYNHFRYSTLPIGVAPFSTYVELTTAAPEISGWWDITPQPGVKQDDGTVVRWSPGSGQASMIFKGTDKKQKAWELLKWWMSKETQTEFATSLQTLFGPEYMWNTANLDAFAQLPLPEEHKQVVLEQWKYLREVPKTPYAYMVEREISNVWNRVVFEGENVRAAVDDSVIRINREMRRKLEEFGYMENGKVVKPYKIPTIETIERWLGGNE